MLSQEGGSNPPSGIVCFAMLNCVLMEKDPAIYIRQPCSGIRARKISSH